MASLIGWWPVPGHVPQDRRGDGLGPVGDLQRGRREAALERLVAGEATALVAPAGEEHELELGDDRAGHPAHHVVEALVGVVVLDAAAADVADRAVDDHHLAVVEVEDVLEPAGRPTRAELAASDDEHPVVPDDVDAGREQLREEGLAPEVHLAADGVDLQPDGDALGDLGRQRLAERRPDVARLVAVDEQVDVVAGRGDVLEHAREVAAPVQERLDRGRDGRGEVHGQLPAGDDRRREQGPGGVRRVLGADGVRARRVGASGGRRDDAGGPPRRPRRCRPRASAGGSSMGPGGAVRRRVARWTHGPCRVRQRPSRDARVTSRGFTKGRAQARRAYPWPPPHAPHAVPAEEAHDARVCASRRSACRNSDLPEMSRNDISRVIDDARDQIAEIEMPDLSKVELPKIDLSKIDVPKAVATAAFIGRAAPRARWPFVLGGIVGVAALTAVVLSQPPVRARLQELARTAKMRIDERRAEMEAQAPGRPCLRRRRGRPGPAVGLRRRRADQRLALRRQQRPARRLRRRPGVPGPGEGRHAGLARDRPPSHARTTPLQDPASAGRPERRSRARASVDARGGNPDNLTRNYLPSCPEGA